MKDSKIPYVQHTFNPWWGCVHVSSGCANCYAARYAHRFGDWWGPYKPRRLFGNAHWAEPLAWNRQAEKRREPARVLCGSMCDVFELQPGNPEHLGEQRKRLFDLVEQTTWLRWMLLTKRPENIIEMVPARWLVAGEWPQHVMTGASIEDQEAAKRRLRHLLPVPGPHFLSMEPLIGAVDLIRATKPDSYAWDEVNYQDNDDCEPEEMVEECEAECDWVNYGNSLVTNPEWENWHREREHRAKWLTLKRCVQWVIVGGESGPHARIMHPEWVNAIRGACAAMGIPFYLKQWGDAIGRQRW